MQNITAITKNVVTFVHSKKEKLMEKKKFCGFLMGSLLVLMTSCLGGDSNNNLDEWNLGNAQIATFSLTNDSIEGLSKVKFTIDQINGKIFNKDSMPYGTVIEEKVLCSVTYDSPYGSIATISFIQPLTNDTIWGTNDSIDFTSPVTITVYPLDGISTKIYEAKINIHQVNPDTMIWEKYADLIPGKVFGDMKVLLHNDYLNMYVAENGVFGLYKAEETDPSNMKEVKLSDFPNDAVLSQIVEFEGDLYIPTKGGALYCSFAEQNTYEEQIWRQIENVPKIKALLGFLPENKITSRASILSCIIEDEDKINFATATIDMEWKTGNEVPESFPVTGFGGYNYESMYHPRFILVSGRDSKNNLSNKTWSTMDGVSWTPISNDKATFSPREGVAISYYDNRFFLVGGIDASGEALNDIYYSLDQGVTWKDSTYVMPEECVARGFSSVFVDDKNYMMLFGGKAGKDTNVLNELWRGRINRLGFGKE